MFRKIRKTIREFKLTMRMKLVLSLSSIAVILLISSFITIMEYSRMSNYVSNLIANNIGSINTSQSLADAANEYNLSILSVIGDSSAVYLPRLNQDGVIAHCDSLKASLSSSVMRDLADSVMQSYSVYMTTSEELPEVILSDFIDTRAWYFDSLQPRYRKLHQDITVLNTAIYNELRKNSATFDRGFYRSIIPGAVAVSVGLLLVLLLMFFLMTYYVNPIYRMLSGLDNYRSFGTKYNCSFDGDDQLSDLNDGIAEIIGENIQLRKRLKTLRTAAEKTVNEKKVSGRDETGQAETGQEASE